MGIATRTAGTVLLGAAALAASALAQPRRGEPTLYDPRTVETVRGTVTRIDKVERERRPHPGMHLELKTDAESITVRLGPAWYVQQQGLDLSTGDRVTVKGSRRTIDGAPTIIAAEITRGDRTVTLRDAAGLPRWGRRGARP